MIRYLISDLELQEKIQRVQKINSVTYVTTKECNL